MIKNAEENIRGIRKTETMKPPEEKGNNHKIMTVQEVASYLRISRFSVYNLVKRGELPAMKILNKFRFNREAIEDYLNEQKLMTS